MVKPPRYLADFNLKDLPKLTFDAVVIGSGIAGISSVYHMGKDIKVALLTKNELSLTATRYAQGGIAAAIGEGDSAESHFQDTIKTGRGLCDEEAVRVLVTEGPAEIETLRDIGATFDVQPGGRLSLTREAGHSFSRVVHNKDTTGGEVESTLAATVKKLPNVSIFERVFVMDVITENNRTVGVLAILDGKLTAFIAPVVIIAAGGMGQLYSVTTNPPISTGDGLAMAFRAGAVLTDVEFVQFHPTALHTPIEPRFLISEAVRGEGAILKDKNGVRFMEGRHPMAELAPRDVVVREEIIRMKETGDDHMYLDCRHMGSDFFQERFPAIFDELVSFGIDVDTDMIPVSPAAHYMSGGVKTDLFGRTGIDGLYACGEVACTGVHGANRLASNSLLEGLVYSRRAAVSAREYIKEYQARDLPDIKFQGTGKDFPGDYAADEIVVLQKLMQADAAVVKSAPSLERAIKFIDNRRAFLSPPTQDCVEYELANLLTVGMLVSSAALAREESRGSHWREDFPEENDADWKKHIEMTKGEDEWVKLKII